jgi:hypothetical protein
MGKPLREFGEIRNGNILIIKYCQGAHQCGGYLRVPFTPGIDGSPDGKPSKENGPIWKRITGETIDTLTLNPSLDFGECGHFNIINGEIINI